MSASVNKFDFETRMQLGVGADQTTSANEFVWGGSVTKIGSTYHCYIDKWDNVDGIDGYAYYGKIYYGSSANRLGPWNSLTELTELKSQTWTAGSVVNPIAIVFGDKIYLFWTGTTSETPSYPLVGTNARNNQRIGVAYTDISTPGGPFTLLGSNPILPPRAGQWDELFINNPWPYIARDGSLKMVYKSCTIAAPTTLKIGIATAPHPLGTWVHAAGPITSVTNIEESAVWREDEFYYMITKAQDNTYVTANSGILLYSKTGNADDWHLVTDKTLAYRLTSKNTDYVATIRTRMERPFVLVENGVAVAYFMVYLRTDGLTSFNLGVNLRS